MPTPTQQNTTQILLLNSKLDTSINTIDANCTEIDRLRDESTHNEVELANLKVFNKELQDKLKALDAQVNGLTANQASMSAKLDADKDQLQQLWRWVYWLVTLLVATIVGILVKVLWR
ncbi:MAG: hypothetical protein ACRC8S_02130 [Fimbriiglobus sp.]